jgi:hypothetical protein
MILNIFVKKNEMDRSKIDEMWDLVKEVQEIQARSAKELEKLEKMVVESKEESKMLIKELAQQMGGISTSNGYFAENFFFNALNTSLTLGKIKFDEASRNLRHKRNGVEDEFDITMYNGKSVAIVEVKYCVEIKHLNALKSKKVENFKWLYPEYEGYDIYLGIAGMSIANNKVINEAKDLGIALLEAKGDFVHYDNDVMKAY